MKRKKIRVNTASCVATHRERRQYQTNVVPHFVDVLLGASALVKSGWWGEGLSEMPWVYLGREGEGPSTKAEHFSHAIQCGITGPRLSSGWARAHAPRVGTYGPSPPS